MRARLLSANVLVWFSAALILLACGPLRGQAADMKVEAQLLWGTDDDKSPNPKHKPVEPEIRKKLKQLPLRWKNYFEECRVLIKLPPGAAKKTSLSAYCDLEVKNLDGTRVEVTHYGAGKRVATRTQSLPKGEMLVLGGNAPDSTAWLVVLRRLE